MKEQNDKKSKMEEFVKLLEGLAPSIDRFGSGNISIDKSGLLFYDMNLSAYTETVGCCIFPTMDVVERAKAVGIEFLVSHYTPSNGILRFMRENRMNGYIAHLSQDVAKYGNIELMALHLYLKDYQKCSLFYQGKMIENGMILGNIPKDEHEKIIGSAEARLEEVIRRFINDNDEIGGKFFGEEPKSYKFGKIDENTLIALSSGDSIKSSFLTQAKKRGANIFIGGSSNTHAVVTAQELGMSIYDIGHYRTLIPGMIHFANTNLTVFIPNTSQKIFDPYGRIQ